MRVRRLLVTLVATAVFAALPPTAHASTGNPLNHASGNAVMLAVIGDTPYGDEQVAQFPSLVDDINGDPKVDVVAHLGDIKTGGSLCTDDYFAQIATQFDAFKDPLVFTPGDNEWTDCHFKIAGRHEPLERLEGIDEGHASLLDWIEGWILSLEERRTK